MPYHEAFGLTLGYTTNALYLQQCRTNVKQDFKMSAKTLPLEFNHFFLLLMESYFKRTQLNKFWDKHFSFLITLSVSHITLHLNFEVHFTPEL